MVIHSQMVGFCFFFYIAHINSKSGWWFHRLVISILTWDNEFQWLSICSEAGGSSCRKYDDGTFAETPSFSVSFTLTNPSTNITLPMFDGRTQIFNGKTLSSLVKRSCEADACWYQQEQVQWYQWCRWSPGMVQCWSQGRHNTGHTMPRKFSIGKRSWCAMKRSLQRIFPLWGTSRCGTCQLGVGCPKTPSSNSTSIQKPWSMHALPVSRLCFAQGLLVQPFQWHQVDFVGQSYHHQSNLIISWYRKMDADEIPFLPKAPTYIYIYWLVVWNMAFIFHFIYGMSSFPLTSSYVSRWLKPPTRLYIHIYIYIYGAMSGGLTPPWTWRSLRENEVLNQWISCQTSPKCSKWSWWS